MPVLDGISENVNESQNIMGTLDTCELQSDCLALRSSEDLRNLLQFRLSTLNAVMLINYRVKLVQPNSFHHFCVLSTYSWFFCPMLSTCHPHACRVSMSMKAANLFLRRHRTIRTMQYRHLLAPGRCDVIFKQPAAMSERWPSPMLSIAEHSNAASMSAIQ